MPFARFCRDTLAVNALERSWRAACLIPGVIETNGDAFEMKCV